ncbi:MAG: RNA-binding protein [Clostridiaceae bacterium]|nr:RNA-binding protein [Clostridiaceae bacterium]
MEFLPGDLVLSTAGRDKGRYFIIIKVIENFAFICDGDLRRYEKPKKKKLKHLKHLGISDAQIKEKILCGQKITNSEIRKRIAHMLESDEISSPKGG